MDREAELEEEERRRLEERLDEEKIKRRRELEEVLDAEQVRERMEQVLQDYFKNEESLSSQMEVVEAEPSTEDADGQLQEHYLEQSWRTVVRTGTEIVTQSENALTLPYPKSESVPNLTPTSCGIVGSETEDPLVTQLMARSKTLDPVDGQVDLSREGSHIDAHSAVISEFSAPQCQTTDLTLFTEESGVTRLLNADKNSYRADNLSTEKIPPNTVDDFDIDIPPNDLSPSDDPIPTGELILADEQLPSGKQTLAKELTPSEEHIPTKELIPSQEHIPTEELIPSETVTSSDEAVDLLESQEAERLETPSFNLGERIQPDNISKADDTMEGAPVTVAEKRLCDSWGSTVVPYAEGEETDEI